MGNCLTNPSDNKKPHTETNGNNTTNNNGTNHIQQQNNTGNNNGTNHTNGNNGTHRDTPAQEDVKILLLGSGDSGKSTLFKQIKITEKGGFTREEVIRYLNSIYGNIIQTVDSLLTILAEKGQSGNLLPSNLPRVSRLREVTKDEGFMWVGAQRYTEDLAQDIEELAKDPAIGEAFERFRYEAHVFEGASYFFKDLARLRPPKYYPDQIDILYCRQKTTGINDTTFDYKGFRLKVVDVGGQRPERKKWINSYDGVHAVMFVASLGDYDQLCYEDDNTNRMEESIDLFDETINSRHFQDTIIILLLNKTDVFSRKIKEKSIKTLFPDYEGADTFEESVKFIEKKYLDVNKYDPDRIFTFWSCATETEQIKEVFTSVKDKVIEMKTRK